MARRPKRTLTAELTAHRQLAQAARESCSALVTLEPDVAELFVARKMLDDAVAEIDRKLAALAAEESAPAAVSTPERSLDHGPSAQ